VAYRSGIDAQLGLAAETTWGVFQTPARFLEFTTESLKLDKARVESKGIRKGKRVQRSDQWAAGRVSVGGDVEFEVGNKGFGLLFKHMLGSVTTTSPGTTTKKHSCQLGDPYGLGFTVQMGRPDTGGTVDPFAYLGCKVTNWELSNAVDDILMLKLGLDGSGEDTSTGLAAASAPAETENLYWTGGSVTIAGTEISVKDVSFTGDNGMKTDRHFIRSGAATKKEQLAAQLAQLGGNLTAEFEGLTAYNRFVNGTVATIVGTWTGSLDRDRPELQGGRHGAGVPVRRRHAERERAGRARAEAAVQDPRRRHEPADPRRLLHDGHDAVAVSDARDISSGPVQVQGLRQFDRFLGRVSKDAQRELRSELRVIARSVRDEARQQAIGQGFGGTGRSGRGRGELLRKLTYGVRGGLAYIAEGAVRTEGRGAPFKYPAVFEYGRRQHRPFLLPALDAKRQDVYRGIEDLFDRLTSENGLGRGGLL
jgi:hypothetical protein